MRLVSVIVLAAIAAAAALPTAGLADPAALPRGQERASPYMRVFGVTQAPYGFVQFCARMPEECQQGPPEEQRFSATPERLSELDTINRTVNREITPATDMEIYGQAEYWTIPTTRGDCEDYALLKRKRLMARGWPATALLMTVVDRRFGAAFEFTRIWNFLKANAGNYVLAYIAWLVARFLVPFGFFRCCIGIVFVVVAEQVEDAVHEEHAHLRLERVPALVRLRNRAMAHGIRLAGMV
jgi:predicted transglutaminase-like cysteine proteinase